MTRSTVSSRTRTASCADDQSLMEIINDEAGAFFAGEKTAEETAQIIQNRVQLYMAEQS